MSFRSGVRWTFIASTATALGCLCYYLKVERPRHLARDRAEIAANVESWRQFEALPRQITGAAGLSLLPDHEREQLVRDYVTSIRRPAKGYGGKIIYVLRQPPPYRDDVEAVIGKPGAANSYQGYQVIYDSKGQMQEIVIKTGEEAGCSIGVDGVTCHQGFLIPKP